jgi:hypothetical protein
MATRSSSLRASAEKTSQSPEKSPRDPFSRTPSEVARPYPHPRVRCSGLQCVNQKDSNFDFATTEFCAQGTECNTSAFCGLGTECGLDYADSCAGNVLTYCDVGKITPLDCVAAGWKSCVSDKQGTRCSE